MKNIFDQFDEGGASAPPSNVFDQSENTTPPQEVERLPASIRNNNPGAMWHAGGWQDKYGANFGESLNDGLGQGNQIARFPDAVSGAAAQMELLSRYGAVPIRDAVKKWSGGNNVGSYLSVLADAGFSPEDDLASVMADKGRAGKLGAAMAFHEAGRPYPLDDEGWGKAYDLYQQKNGKLNAPSGNAFDQFDDSQGSQTPPPPARNIFDQFDTPTGDLQQEMKKAGFVPVEGVPGGFEMPRNNLIDRAILGVERLAPQTGATLNEGLALVSRAPEVMTSIVDALTGNKSHVTENLRNANLVSKFFAREAAAWRARDKEIAEAGAALGGGLAGDFAENVPLAGLQAIQDAALAGPARVPKALQTVETSLWRGLAEQFTKPSQLRATAAAGAARQSLSTEGQIVEEKQAAQPGLSTEDAQNQALPEGILSGLSTYVLTTLGGYSGAERVFKELGIKGLKAKALDIVKSIPEEAVQEATDQGMQDQLERAFRHPEKSAENSLSEIAFAGALGGIMGGAVTTVGALSEPSETRYTPAKSGEFKDFSQIPQQKEGGSAGIPINEVKSASQSPPEQDAIQRMIEEDLQRKLAEYESEEFDEPPTESTPENEQAQSGDERFAPPDQTSSEPVVIPDDQLEGGTIAEIRAAARAFAKAKGIIGGRFPNNATNWNILVNRETLNHTFTHDGPEHIHAVTVLPELIQAAVPTEIGTPHSPIIPEIAGVHRMEVPFIFRGKTYSAKLTVKEHRGDKGFHLYDLQKISVEKEREPAGKVLPPGTAETELRDEPTAGSDKTVGQQVQNVNEVSRMANDLRRRAQDTGEAGFLDPSIFDDVAEFGRNILREGMKFAEWAAQMVRHLGKNVTAALQKIWRSITGANYLPHARESGAVRGGPTIKPLASPGIRSQQTMTKTIWEMGMPSVDLDRFYMGTADILEKQPGLKFLGRAIRKHVDTQRKYYGQFTAPYRAWEQRHGRGDRRQGLKEFEGYWREHERNKTLARDAYRLASPAGKQLIDLWKDTANEAGMINQKNNVMVWDGQLGVMRPIGRVGPEYFPRMIKPKILKILKNPAKNPKGRDQLVREMLAEGLITKPEDADEYMSKAWNSYKANDHFGAIESARNLPLPNKAYDYSFETAQRYIRSWTERMAQIEAFGQKLRGNNAGKDLFDMAQELAGDEATQKYIKLVQDRAYNARLDNGLTRLAGSMNTLATGLQLGNPSSALKNLVSGLAFTAQAYGTRRTVAAMGSLVSDFRQINDAYEKGILLDDLMNIMRDGEQAGVSKVGPLAKFTNFMLNATGFNSAEQFVRGVNMVAARAMLRDALKANERNPLSRKSKQYRGFFARIGIKSPQALIDEGGTGEITDQFLRAAVNEVQGGYRYDQVPAFMDSPTGKFLFKYQKWGSQQLRHFQRNVANPALQFFSGGKIGAKEFIRVRNPETGVIETHQVPGQIMPLVRYMIGLGLAGAATEQLLKLIFGVPEKEATWAEVIAALDKDIGRGLAILSSKIWGYHLLAGSLGLLGNYAQLGMDITQRSRFKNPADPPGISPLKGVMNTALDWLEQGTLTPDNIDNLLRQQVSLYRTGKQAAARVNDVFGTEVRALNMETRRQDLQWLRGVTQRYNDSLRVQQNRTSFGRIGKSPQSPFRDGLKQDLLLGDTKAARRRINEHFRGMSDERAKVEMAGLMASVRASQPIKAGYGSEAMRQNFLGWAKENLAPEDMARVKMIDSTYRRTAQALGLLRPDRDISEEDLLEAMDKIRVRAGR